ncbi:MAG TPA: methionine--tRNA ligase [Longimicrobiales bacterium]|nr:methionine--tRNA ligase [Longimicrobiales bacterium]
MNPRRTRYITTAIDYANGAPHLGHALEKIGADAMARYRRRKGAPVHFVVGMDEHGLKVLQSAEERGITPQAWVDELADRFSDAWSRLALSNDDFIRTTEARHRRAAQEIIRRIHEAGDLYTDTYAGYYCIGCEAYKTEAELEPRDGTGERAEPGPDRAAELRCPLHRSRALEWMEEENWFFRLSRYQDRLLDLLEERPEFVQPEIRRNEVRKVIEGGLEDISVSRGRLEWGVPWPDDPTHVVYVWIEALTNYLSATGFPEDGYQEYWPADIHVIGKDITRFHCVYWPALLMSAGLELPRSVWAHGFINFGGGKMSKSEGVSVSLDEAIERHGPEALRYYLLRDIPWNGDGDFSWERFDDVYTAELANDLGNLANRSISMIERYREGVVPDGRRTGLDERIPDTMVRYRAAMDGNLLHQGIAAAMELTAAANGFVEEQAPWSQARDPATAVDLDATLAALARALTALCVMLEPFLPGKMRQLATALGLADIPLLEDVADFEPAGRTVRRGAVLFPRPDREQSVR